MEKMGLVVAFDKGKGVSIYVNAVMFPKEIVFW